METKQKILGLDFAALRTLQFVFELGSFSKAAEALEQTQSNVSYTISRLRDCLNDPLFVREGRKMVPTERCRTVVAETAHLLETFQSLASHTEFDAATAEGLVTIACNHYERFTILPQFIRALREDAPGISLRVSNSLAQGEELLKRGECDVLLGPVQFIGDKIFKRHIRLDHYCCIMDPANSLNKGPLTLKRIEAANHITLKFSNLWRPLYFSRFEAKGIRINPVVELAEYGDIGGYILGSDLIAVVPRQIANGLDSNIVRKDIPLNVSIEIDAFWTARTHKSPLHKWVRERLALAAKNSEIRH